MFSKRCPKCGEDRDLTQWSKNSSKKDGLQTNCKICVKYSNAEYYKRTPSKNEKRALRAKIQGPILKGIIRNHLNKNPCIDCGNDDIRVLEFDHVRGKKKYNISRMISGGHSEKTLLEEIEKCEVRCANCHRIATLTRSNNSWRLE